MQELQWPGIRTALQASTVIGIMALEDVPYVFCFILCPSVPLFQLRTGVYEVEFGTRYLATKLSQETHTNKRL